MLKLVGVLLSEKEGHASKKVQSMDDGKEAQVLIFNILVLKHGA